MADPSPTPPETELFERGAALAALRGQTDALRAGQGGCVLIEAAAGLGKSSLLRAWRAGLPGGVDWWGGACEPLQAPPPLAPWLDMLADLPPRVADRVRDGRIDAGLYADLLSLLQRPPRPLVLVLEDLQWADAATLDLLRYLSRRVETTSTLLVLTWREAELAAIHPLRSVLAGLAGSARCRLQLQPLAAGTVAQWARACGRDPEGLHEATGGNPFYVAQLLQAPPGSGLPAPVRDALLARLARLPVPAREVVELVSLSPSPLEIDALKAALAPDPDHLELALHSGLVEQDGARLRLVHELTRAALSQAVGARAPALHAGLYDALGQLDPPPGRLVHHAERAGLAAAVLRLAPQAAAAASAARAHRQAAAHYAAALAHADRLAPAAECALAEAHAEECLLTNQLEAAFASRQRALALARTTGDVVAQGRQLRVMARLEWIRGQPVKGVELAMQAITLLEAAEPEGREWAMACLTMGQLQLLVDDPMRACDWVDRALPRLRALGDREAEAYALNTAGAARLGTAHEAHGLATIERALRIALGEGLEELAARAWTNLVAAALVQRRLADVETQSVEAIAYCRGRDLDLFAIHLEMRRALGWVAAGRWQEGAVLLDQLASRPDLNPMQRAQLPWLRRFMALRLGRPGAEAAWRALAEDGPPLSPTPWYFDPALMRIEAAWLAGDDALARRVAEQAWADPAPRREGWRRAELAVWRCRLRLAAEVQPSFPAPARWAVSGDVAAAAQAWQEAGLPYEQALALADGDERQRREALERLLAIGAMPAARRVRAALRAAGARALPRGPYVRARQDRLGLTARQREVLECLRQGLSNREIADRLHRSARTVENHVATLIDKLGARDRHDAVRRANEI